MSGLWLNGQQVAVAVEPGTPLKEFVEQQLDEMLPEDQVVCGVKIDGGEGDLEAVRWGEFERLELTTGTTSDLARQGLEQSQLLVNGIIEQVGRCAAALRQGEKQRFQQMFVAVIDDLLAFLRFLALVQACVGKRQEVLERFGQRLQERVDELLKVQQQGDSVLMADMLEYEMVPLFAGWEGLRQVLAQALEDEDHE